MHVGVVIVLRCIACVVLLAKQGVFGFWQSALLMDICLLCKECAAAVPMPCSQQVQRCWNTWQLMASDRKLRRAVNEADACLHSAWGQLPLHVHACYLNSRCVCVCKYV